MTQKETLKVIFVGSKGGKMLIAHQTVAMKADNAQSTVPRLREGRPDHVVQFDEHG